MNILFIYSSVGENLDSFHILTTINNAGLHVYVDFVLIHISF